MVKLFPRELSVFMVRGLLLFVMGMSACGYYCKAEVSLPTAVAIQRAVTNALAEFSKTDDPKILERAYNRAGKGHPLPEGISETAVLQFQQVLLVLQICYQARDKNYDVKTADRGTLNVSPPHVPGKVPYLGGVTPEAIEEPDIRKAYEEKIAGNKRKHEKYDRESKLEEILLRGISDVRTGIEAFPLYSNECKQTIAIIKRTITNETLRVRVLDGFVPK